MSSILDKYQLTQETFELCICNGATKNDLLSIFKKTGNQMDSWCFEVYGFNFQTTYEWIRTVALNEYFDTIKELGFRGNATALTIMNQNIQRLSGDQVTKIVFSNSVSTVGEEDKKDDDY